MKTLLAIALAPLALVSCVPQDLTGDTISRNEAGQVQSIQTGVVQSVRYVKIQGESTAGSIIGGIAGGIAGNQVGAGRGNTLATLAGVGLGAAAGGAAEQKLMNRQGIELTIRMSDGEVVAITQENTDRESFEPGDRVKVIYGNRTRVTHY